MGRKLLSRCLLDPPSKRIRTPEAADLPVGSETAVKEHTPTAPALASELVAPVQRLADPLSKRIRMPESTAPPPASGPELHASLPPAISDAQAELAGEAPSAASPGEASVGCAGALHSHCVSSAEWRAEVVGGDCRRPGGGARAGVCFLPCWAVGGQPTERGDRAKRARAGAAAEGQDRGLRRVSEPLSAFAVRHRAAQYVPGALLKWWAVGRVRWGDGGRDRGLRRVSGPLSGVQEHLTESTEISTNVFTQNTYHK
jgi:hypothetical protein